MNARLVYISIAIATICLLVTVAYMYWVTFMYWYQACYPLQKVCVEGKYINWSTLEYRKVFWSPSSKGDLENCPIVLVIHGKNFRIGDLDPVIVNELGARRLDSTNGIEIWTRIPSSDDRLDLTFCFERGRIVGFSLKLPESDFDAGMQHTSLKMLINDRELTLPIQANELDQILGSPQATQRDMMWP